jgi:hypothetical protein
MRLRRHAARLELDVAHLPAYRSGPVEPQYSPPPRGGPCERPGVDVLRQALADARSWSEVLRRLGVRVCGYNITWVREDASRIGITTLQPQRFCAYRRCGAKLSASGSNLYCSLECHRDELMAAKVQHWLDTGETGCLDRPCKAIRSYLLAVQENKCAICGNPNVWMDRPLSFIFDHIDGNSSDNRRQNVRLICPNCDSQLGTYKGRNRGSGRFARRQRYAANKSF